MKTKVLIGILGISLLLTGCGEVSKLKNGEEVVAKLDGKTITADDLYKELKSKGGSSILVNLIDQFIADKELETTDEMKQNAESDYNTYKTQYESYGQDFDEVLKSSGYADKQEFIDELILSEKKEELAKKYLKEEITDNEINAEYQNNIFGEMTVRHILISPDTTDDMTEEEKETKEEEAKKKAEDLIKQLDQGADFATLAKENSDDEGSKEDGGLVSDFTKDSVVESFWNASMNLKDGEYTKEPVESDYGYHIILRVSQKEKPKLEDVKDDILTDLADQKLQEDYTLIDKTWVTIRKKYKLNIEDSELKDGYQEIINSIDAN